MTPWRQHDKADVDGLVLKLRLQIHSLELHFWVERRVYFSSSVQNTYKIKYSYIVKSTGGFSDWFKSKARTTVPWAALWPARRPL